MMFINQSIISTKFRCLLCNSVWKTFMFCGTEKRGMGYCTRWRRLSMNVKELVPPLSPPGFSNQIPDLDPKNATAAHINVWWHWNFKTKPSSRFWARLSACESDPPPWEARSRPRGWWTSGAPTPGSAAGAAGKATGQWLVGKRVHLYLYTTKGGSLCPSLTSLIGDRRNPTFFPDSENFWKSL